MADVEERGVLEGQDAIDLWRQGRDAWNAWVAENPVADIDFSRVDFSAYAYVSFAGFHFPGGKKDFSHTVFGDGNVSFRDATLGDGDVSFDRAQFANGRVTLNHATFGKGGVSFRHATIGKGRVSFRHVTFGEGDVSFHSATFDASHIYFQGTTFGAGGITFADADLGKGSLIFDAAFFDDNHISFRNANINGHLQLQNCENTKTIGEISFRAMRLTGTFILEGDFTCVPDLRSTTLSAHVDLENLRIEASPHELKSPEDDKYAKGDPNIARLRRPKELAEQNRHHEAALRFFALERRDMRWTTSLSAGASALDWFYDMACVYSQSVMRPAAILVGLFAVFAGVYGLLDPCLGAWGAAVKSAYYTVPFVFIKSARPAAAMFSDPVHALTMAQQGFSFICLFLLGVGLRTRFRL